MGFSLTYLKIDIYPLLVASIVYLQQQKLYDSFEASPYSCQHELLSKHLWVSTSHKPSFTVENIIFDLVVETKNFESFTAWREQAGARDYQKESDLISSVVSGVGYLRWSSNIDRVANNFAKVYPFSPQEVKDFLLRKNPGVKGYLCSASPAA
jgi:hypothetical protein